MFEVQQIYVVLTVLVRKIGDFTICCISLNVRMGLLLFDLRI